MHHHSSFRILSHDGRHHRYHLGSPENHIDDTYPELRELAEAVSQNTDLINTMSAQLQQLIEENRKWEMHATYKRQELKT